MFVLKLFVNTRSFKLFEYERYNNCGLYPTTISIASGYLKNEQGAYGIYESPRVHTGDGGVHTTVEELVK